VTTICFISLKSHITNASVCDSYIGIFSVLFIIYIVATTATVFYYNYCSINASRTIHARLVDSVFRAPLRFVLLIAIRLYMTLTYNGRWLDEIPVARVITRCTQDIGIIDGPIFQALMQFVIQLIGMCMKLGAIVIFAPLFVVPGIFVGLFAIFFGKTYLKARTSAKYEARQVLNYLTLVLLI
jgi:ABC-type multidrug transport system fused ATPase/permease subunit